MRQAPQSFDPPELARAVRRQRIGILAGMQPVRALRYESAIIFFFLLGPRQRLCIPPLFSTSCMHPQYAASEARPPT